MLPLARYAEPNQLPPDPLILDLPRRLGTVTSDMCARFIRGDLA